MEIDPEQLRRQYAELSDEGLLSIDRNDLTELAQHYYDAEVAARGLDSESPLETEQPDEELVLVETFLSAEDANLGRALLRSAEIPAYLENELTSGWTGAGGKCKAERSVVGGEQAPTADPRPKIAISSGPPRGGTLSEIKPIRTVTKL